MSYIKSVSFLLFKSEDDSWVCSVDILSARFEPETTSQPTTVPTMCASSNYSITLNILFSYVLDVKNSIAFNIT